MNVTILGQTPSQKNSKRIFRNSRTGASFIASSQITKDWQEEAAWQLKGKTHIETPASIYYRFFVKDNRGRDLDNMIASVNDALQHAGIIVNDSWQWLEIAGAYAQIDKENPRVEVRISPING